MENQKLLKKARAHVEALFRGGTPDWVMFHNFEHAKAVAKAGREIGVASDLSSEDLEVVILAAWFHDLGYLDGADGHEEKSTEMAASFLRSHRYPEEKIALAARCIRATRIPQRPRNLLEQVLCDADVAHLGSRKFPELTEFVRVEFEHRAGRRFSEVEWLTMNTNFLAGHRYHTAFARSKYGEQQGSNLKTLMARLNQAKPRSQ